MKKFYTLLLFLCLMMVIACQTSSKVSTERLLTAKMFQTHLQKNKGQLVDVRTPTEYQEGHIAHAVNIDFYATDFQQQLEQLKLTDAVYVYCRSGGRSGKTAKQLEKMGFKDVYDLKGGITAWQKQQLEVVH